MGSFAVQVKAFAEKTKGNADLIIRKASLDVFSNVVLKTPVDKGRARGNWQPSIGGVMGGTVEQLDPSGAATIASIQAMTAQFGIGEVMYLANNLPYIKRLEEGYSQQAPAGMVALTVQSFQRAIDAAVAEVAD